MRLGFLTAPFPDTPLMEVADWAAASAFEVLEIACWPVACPAGRARPGNAGRGHFIGVGLHHPMRAHKRGGNRPHHRIAPVQQSCPRCRREDLRFAQPIAANRKRVTQAEAYVSARPRCAWPGG